MKFLADELSEKENYKFLSGAIIPRPIAFALTVSPDGIVNAAPFSFFNVVSSDPAIVSIAVQRRNGEMKDTARNAIQSGELMIHIVSEDFVRDVNETAANLPPDESELARTNLHLSYDGNFAVPKIEEAKIKLAAAVWQVLQIQNDAREITADLILARILEYDMDESVLNVEKGYLLADEIKPVSRLAGSDYAKLGERFKLNRPK
ncbi:MULTISPECIES: flavin reductase family protein [Listeria]|uniref:flavin reductase family protein n=1 Tax=Listeria TaxID=1637 RepID=UPI000B5978F0|nr:MULTISPECIES: flavin reductase family protein [Listeria]